MKNLACYEGVAGLSMTRDKYTFWVAGSCRCWRCWIPCNNTQYCVGFLDGAACLVGARHHQMWWCSFGYNPLGNVLVLAFAARWLSVWAGLTSIQYESSSGIDCEVDRRWDWHPACCRQLHSMRRV